MSNQIIDDPKCDLKVSIFIIHAKFWKFEYASRFYQWEFLFFLIMLFSLFEIKKKQILFLLLSLIKRIIHLR